MKHNYIFEKLNEQNIRISYERIYEENLFEQIEVLRRFGKKRKKRNEEK